VKRGFGTEFGTGLEQDGLSAWYSWVDSNHRPPDPQSGALNQLSYSCPAAPIGERRNLEEKILLGKDAIPTENAEIAAGWRVQCKSPGVAPGLI
jgi:hypothetical protein